MRCLRNATLRGSNTARVLILSAQLSAFIATLFSSTWGLNSSFAIAFVGGLTGAFGGALGAQHIVERSKRRDELLKELRNTNAATMVAFSICNAAMALKKQHVQPMYEQFVRDNDAIHAFKEQRAAGQLPGTEYRFMADLRSFPAPTVPIETLKGLVFEKISAYGRPLALVSVLDQSLVGLREAIVKRDAIAQRVKSGSILSEQVTHHYFGWPLSNGDTNQEYPDLVAAIHTYVDDIVFFSTLLCTDLISHGNKARAAFTKKFGKGAPKVSTVDLSSPREKGLIPPEAQYADWINAFMEHDSGSRTNGSKQ